MATPLTPSILLQRRRSPAFKVLPRKMLIRQLARLEMLSTTAHGAVWPQVNEADSSTNSRISSNRTAMNWHSSSLLITENQLLELMQLMCNSLLIVTATTLDGQTRLLATPSQLQVHTMLTLVKNQWEWLDRSYHGTSHFSCKHGSSAPLWRQELSVF